MPFISKEEVKAKRDALKKEFPRVKFHVKWYHYSSICVNIMEAPFEITKEQENVNHYYIAEHYANSPEVRDFLLKVKEIINKGNYTASVDGDYGNIPSFYINIKFGEWDKPYKKID